MKEQEKAVSLPVGEREPLISWNLEFMCKGTDLVEDFAVVQGVFGLVLARVCSLLLIKKPLQFVICSA